MKTGISELSKQSAQSIPQNHAQNPETDAPTGVDIAAD